MSDKAISRNIRLKETTVRLVEQMAKEENRSFNNMVETLLIRYLKNIPNHD